MTDHLPLWRRRPVPARDADDRRVARESRLCALGFEDLSDEERERNRLANVDLLLHLKANHELR